MFFLKFYAPQKMLEHTIFDSGIYGDQRMKPVQSSSFDETRLVGGISELCVVFCQVSLDPFSRLVQTVIFSSLGGKCQSVSRSFSSTGPLLFYELEYIIIIAISPSSISLC